LHTIYAVGMSHHSFLERVTISEEKRHGAFGERKDPGEITTIDGQGHARALGKNSKRELVVYGSCTKSRKKIL